MRQPSMSAGRVVLTALVVGVIGWLGVVAIGAQLASTSAARLGFDLELLLGAGRDIAAGKSPYAPALIAGSAPTATELFYSYPPPVAQAMTLISGVPSRVVLVVWGLVAVGGMLLIADALRRRLAPERPRWLVLAICASAAPLVLPFSVGLLFGNLDVFFPLLYGAMLLAVLDAERRSGILGGLALVAASLKLHPASMGLWFLARAIRERGGVAGVVVLAALAAGVAVVAVSVAIGGVGLWTDYAAVVRSGTTAVIVDPAKNAGIAAVIAGALGGGDSLARSIHPVVALLAIAITLWAGWRRGDAVEGFAWASAASLSMLPVTWYHYPSAMIPVGLAAWLRSGPAQTSRVRAAIVAAMVVGAVAIAALPLLWVAIGLVILAVHWSRQPAATAASAASMALAPEGG